MSKHIQPAMLQTMLNLLDNRLNSVVLCFERKNFEEVNVYGIFKKKRMIIEHKTYTMENDQTVFIVPDEFDGMELNEIKYLDIVGKLLYVIYPNRIMKANTIFQVDMRTQCQIN